METPFELDSEQKEIKKKIFPYLKALTYELVQKQPEHLEQFMIDFLTKQGNYTTSGLTKDEKKELEFLRIKVKHYRDLENHNLIKSNASSQKELEINPNQEIDSENSYSEEKDDVMDENEEALINNKLNNIKKAQDIDNSIKSRVSVSAEVYGFYNKKQNFVPKIIQKNEDQMNRIKGKIISSFIFSSLEKKDLEVVINAMEEKKFHLDDKVITQGEDGDCLYIVETGTLNCYKTFSSESAPKLLKTYQSGDSFGELALLYNCPRAATIICSSDECILWSLDRETFNNIVKEAAQKKREKYENFLKNVDILSTIDSYELGQICDSLKDGYYKKDDYIIKEGELGDVFYILEEGNCNATKTLEPGKPETIINELKEGDYFGERALIRGEPRYANIIVTSNTAKVISLDRLSFTRLLGPIMEILKRNIDKYQVYITNNNKENKDLSNSNVNSKTNINENNINNNDNTNNDNNNNTNLNSINNMLKSENGEIVVPQLNIPITEAAGNIEEDNSQESQNENENKEKDENKNEEENKKEVENNIDTTKNLNNIITSDINEDPNDKKEDNINNTNNEDKKIDENNDNNQNNNKDESKPIDNENQNENKDESKPIDNENQNENIEIINNNTNDNNPPNNNENQTDNNNNLTSLQDMLIKNNNVENELNNKENNVEEEKKEEENKDNESSNSFTMSNISKNNAENNLSGENESKEQTLQPLSNMLVSNEQTINDK